MGAVRFRRGLAKAAHVRRPRPALHVTSRLLQAQAARRAALGCGPCGRLRQPLGRRDPGDATVGVVRQARG